MAKRYPPQFLEDGTELKFCTKCEQWKPKIVEFFYFRPSRQTWESPCRECNSAYMKIYAETYTIDADKQWAAQIKSRYGITEETYWKMFADQGGVCALCGTPPGERNRNKRLSVDHNHDTSEVRGLLCYNCNTAAGLLGDDPVLAAKLVRYLKGDI